MIPLSPGDYEIDLSKPRASGDDPATEDDDYVNP